MTTLAKSFGHSESVQPVYSKNNWYSSLIQKLEFSHYGLIAMAILVGGCLGGITTMQIFKNDGPLWQFIICVSFTMANLVACISQAPTRWVVNLFGLSMLVNVILILVSIL